MVKRGKGGRAQAVDSRPFPPFPLSLFPPSPSARGWTLIELVVTVTVLTILTLGVVPLIKTSVKRHREQQLRETLRGMREAIKEFRRDTVGIQCAGAAAQPGQPGPPGQPGQPGQQFIDPRSKVVISDCTIFGVDNPDHYPPTLETLVEGVSVIPRANVGAVSLGSTRGNATENPLLATRKKVYLRAIPVDPITGKAEWDLRSSYDAADASEWGGQNVFDVRSKAPGTALNGEKYSEW
ncbi:MAG: pilus assembly FimT family protein [Pyrinomonadaceae bacterium]